MRPSSVLFSGAKALGRCIANLAVLFREAPAIKGPASYERYRDQKSRNKPPIEIKLKLNFLGKMRKTMNGIANDDE
jgi:hypothetical protein